MKKIIIFLAFAFYQSINAQTVLLSEGFDNVAGITNSGWSMLNLSSPLGTTGWVQGAGDEDFPSHQGANNSFISSSYDAVAGNGTISNWLFTPVVKLQNNYVIKFWTRTYDVPSYADRMEVRLSTLGANSTNPTSATDVGSFTTLLTTINPTLSVTGYPNSWTEYRLTVTGLTGATDCKIAFRSFVTDGGNSGSNGDYIAVDTFSIESASLGTEENNNLNEIQLFPNPTTELINFSKYISNYSISDLSGRIVASSKIKTQQINISQLLKGVYVISFEDEKGKKQSKTIIKK